MIGDIFKSKNSYYSSVIIVIIIVIIVIGFYEFIENFDETLIKLKTQQCDKCKLYGNMDNSFIGIYKQSLKERIDRTNKDDNKEKDDK